MKRLLTIAILATILGSFGACDNSSRRYIIQPIEDELCKHGFPPGQCKKNHGDIVVDSLEKIEKDSIHHIIWEPFPDSGV